MFMSLYKVQVSCSGGLISLQEFIKKKVERSIEIFMHHLAGYIT